MEFARERDILWDWYFPFPKTSDGPILSDIEALSNFFGIYSNFTSYLTYKFCLPHPKEFVLNSNAMLQSEDICVSEIMGRLRNEPETVLGALHYAVHQTMLNQTTQPPAEKIHIIIAGFQLTNLDDIRSMLVNKFVTICGTVIKVNEPRIYVTSMLFTCKKPRCGKTVEIKQVEGKFTQEKCECGSKWFEPNTEQAKTAIRQRFMIQELQSGTGNRIPTLWCDLYDFECRNLKVSDLVVLTGIVRPEMIEVIRGKTSGLHSLNLEVKSMQREKKVEDFTFSDVRKFKSMACTRNIFAHLINSFAPEIYGNATVKAGCILSLLGGNQQEENRDTSHILLVGDPGTGKTKLLRAIVDLSMRGVFVSAGSTKSGLTVTVNKDLGENAVQAGALIIADEGICAVDEFDKMGNERQVFLEVMEQQTVSVAKAGICDRIKAKTTIIAAANPIGGYYNERTSMLDNLKINSALLSRFDLIFLMVSQHDRNLTRHVMSNMVGKRRKANLAFSDVKTSVSQCMVTPSREENDIIGEEETFTDFIKRLGVKAIIDQIEMKTYLEFAKKTCSPVLSQDALEVIGNFYRHLRSSTELGKVNVTIRVVESLKRLCEARAKVELRETVTTSDALEVVKLFQETVIDVGAYNAYRNTSTSSFLSRQNGGKALGELSKPKQQQAFLEVIQQQVQTRGEQLFTFKELKEVSESLELRVGDFNNFIEKLNFEGYFLKKGPNMYEAVKN